MAEQSPGDLLHVAHERLVAEWAASGSVSEAAKCDLPASIVEAIDRSINCKTLTYRYVLPTQLLAKLVNPALDCRCVQATCTLPGAFDARSLCHEVVVKFDRLNDNVLGGSTEPYANNPLRIPAIIEEHRQAQKNKAGFDDLRTVLDYAQARPELTPALFRVAMKAIRDRLATTKLAFPVPNRVSLRQTLALVCEFLQERTGGLRMQAVAVALFRTIGERLNLFSGVRSANINAADASTGSTADLECVDTGGNIVIAVEVKDRRLTLRHTQDKIPGVREKGIRELLFLVQGGIESGEAEAVHDLIDRQFVTGQNVYVYEFDKFLESCLILFGEAGRTLLLRHVGEELDAKRTDIVHRRKWHQLLQSL